MWLKIGSLAGHKFWGWEEWDHETPSAGLRCIRRRGARKRGLECGGLPLWKSGLTMVIVLGGSGMGFLWAGVLGGSGMGFLMGWCDRKVDSDSDPCSN